VRFQLVSEFSSHVDGEETVVAVSRKSVHFSDIPRLIARLSHFFLLSFFSSASLSDTGESDRSSGRPAVCRQTSQELLDRGGAGSSLSKGNAAIKEALIGLIPFSLMPGDCDRRAFLVNHFYREIGATISRSDDYLPLAAGKIFAKSNRQPRKFIFLIPTRSRTKPD